MNNIKVGSPRTLAILAVILLLGGIAYIYLGTSDEPDPSQPTERMLMIGNSFTYQNNLEKMAEELIETQSLGRRAVESERVAFGGYRLFDHVDDFDENAPDSQLREFFVDGTPDVKDWDLVIFQEQVEIPGLPTFEMEKNRSLESALQLGQLAHETGADVMVLETWGNAFDPEDPTNPYPEFPEMQTHLSVAAVDIVDTLIENDIPAVIAPAGEAFLIVYNDVISSGGNPYDEDSWFLLLFSDDLEHSSVAGSYLAAAVIAATQSQQPIAETDWAPPGIEANFAAYLRQVADRAAFPTEQ